MLPDLGTFQVSRVVDYAKLIYTILLSNLPERRRDGGKMTAHPHSLETHRSRPKYDRHPFNEAI